MKKFILVFSIIITFVITGFSQESKLIGEWTLDKFQVDGKTEKIQIEVTFEDDNDFIYHDLRRDRTMLAAIWTYNEKDDIVNFKGAIMDDIFEGDYNVVKLDENKLSISQGKYKMYFIRKK